MEQLINQLIDDAARAGAPGLVLAAFMLAFGETALFTDLLVPGEIGMIAVGAVSERANVDLWLVIGSATIGATLGDSVGWWLGHRFGLRVLHRFPRVERRLRPGITRAQSYFEHRGSAVVFFGRFIGALRGLVSLVAGAAGMPFRRFLCWNVIASLCWTTLVISAGYAFGRNVDVILGEVGLAVAATTVVGVVVVVIVRHRLRATPPVPTTRSSGCAESTTHDDDSSCERTCSSSPTL